MLSNAIHLIGSLNFPIDLLSKMKYLDVCTFSANPKSETLMIPSLDILYNRSNYYTFEFVYAC